MQRLDRTKKQGSGSFLKKRTKKLLRSAGCDAFSARCFVIAGLGTAIHAFSAAPAK
jgi:hypothetical protein